MTATRRQVLVHNPASGRGAGGRGLEDVVAALRAGGGPVELLATQRAGHATELVADLLARDPAEPLDVLALGGDGTLNEVVAGAHRAGRLRDPRGLRVGVLPGGTTNVVASSLGLPRHPVAAARAIAGGASRAIDVATCTTGTVERPFVLACGAGFDADVLLRVASPLKQRLGRHAYWLRALACCGDGCGPVEVEAEREDGAALRATAASAVVGCCPLYGGHVRFAREARPDDGVLELVLLSSTRLLPLLRAGLKGLAGEMRGAPGVRVERVRSVSLAAPGGRGVHVHVDAEPAGELPARIAVLPRALAVRVPAAR